MKFGKRLMSMALALVMIFGLTTGASAAASQDVTAKLSPDITVKLGNETQAMADANGDPVYPILYNGTTYLPIRAIADIMGLDVTWFAASRTVILAGFAAHTDLSASDEADSKTAPNAASKDVAVRIDPGITVEYNGKTQKMTDANGGAVYPILYNGTTYLPVRAVSDMLDVDVAWNQNTRTVALVKSTGMTSYQWEFGVYNYFDFGNGVKARTQSDEIAVTYRGGKTETFGFDNISDLRAALEKADCAESLIDKAVEIFVGDHNQVLANTPKPASPFKDIQTSSGNGIETVSNTCIVSSWGKLDWSTADNGYVTVTANELVGPKTRIQANVRWDTGYGFSESGGYVYLSQGEWHIPLQGGSTEYVIELKYQTLACEHLLTETERAAANDNHRAKNLVAKFTAEIDDPETIWLLSTPEINFLDAPKTQAKAKELTKNCKTDAEKITAIYNWVSNNIQYDYALYNADVKAAQEWERDRQKQAQMTEEEKEKDWAEKIAYYSKRTETSCLVLGPDGTHWDDSEALLKQATELDPDKTLTTKTGVCRHYAALMTAMLRSVGVQCKYVSGDMYTGKIIKDFSDDGWIGHAWVAVNPKTGTLNISGAGKDYASYSIENGKVTPTDPTGWIRLDPTNASNRALTSNDTNYRTEGYK